MRKTAFTLMEVLVVITVIAVLVAILLPALQNTKEQSRAVVCGSNIRQLFLGFSSYTLENETYPFSFETSVSVPLGRYYQSGRRGWWWFNYISNYYGYAEFNSQTIFWCPSRNITKTDLKNNMLCANYGVNQSIFKEYHHRIQNEFRGLRPLKPIHISNPSQTLLIVDTGYAQIHWQHAADKLPIPLGSSKIEDTAYIPGLGINKERSLWPGLETDAINGRHSGKTINIGFADGHVSRGKAEFTLVEKHADNYKNRSPLWSPR